MVQAAGGDWWSGALLKAWDDYVALTNAVRESAQSSNAAPGPSLCVPIFDAWQQLAGSVGMQSPYDPAKAFNPDQLFSTMAPKLGWTREYQSIVQRMLEIGIEFQRSYLGLAARGTEIAEQALQSTKRQAAHDPRLSQSPSAAYEAWIENAESAYAQAAHGEGFSRSVGEMCNLLSAFKVERGKLLDALIRHLDLPTRAEVDSLHRQVRDLKTALQNLQTAKTTKSTKRKPPMRKRT